jgi:hypothetical protein
LNYSILQKKAILFLLAVVTCSVTYAQCTIQGNVTDSTKAPVPYAAVGLLNAKDSVVVKGTLTNDAGLYSFANVKVTTYLIKIDQPGYAVKYYGPVKPDSGEAKQLPDIMLRSSSKNLNEVSATAQRRVMEFKGGNVVLNVANSVLAQGNSVYDLLEHTPGVVIDNNSIILQGNSQVTIMIDEKPMQVPAAQFIQLLKGMPSENVERIEVLKNPPAKYDASGTGGFINIVSKKAHVYGLSGLIYGTASQGFYLSTYGGIQLNYKTRHFTFYGNINPEYNNDVTPNTLAEHFYSATGTTIFTTNDVNQDIGTALVAKAGIDWNIDSKNSIGIRTDYEVTNDQGSDNSVLSVSGLNSLGFDHNVNAITSPDNNPGISYVVNAEHKFDTAGSAISFSGTCDISNDYDQNNTSSYYYAADNSSVLSPFITYYNNAFNLNIYNCRLDLKKVFKNSLEFETGVKFQYMGLSSFNQSLFYDSKTGQDTVYSMYSNTFTGSETTEAGYVTVIKKTKYLTAGFGLRGENDILVEQSPAYGLDLTRQVFCLFPGMSLEYSKNPDNNFQLTFNRRVDRPDYGQLNPHVSINDQYNYYYGNPYLLPQYSNTFAFTYTFKGFLSSSVSYSHISDYMGEFNNQDNTTYIEYRGWTNINDNDIYAYSLYGSGDAAKWWSISLNGTASYITYGGVLNNVAYTTSGFSYSGAVDNEFLLPGKYKLQVFAFFHGPGVNGIIHSDFWWRGNIFIKRNFIHDKLNLTMGVTDIFHTVLPGSYQQILGSDWTYHEIADSRRFKVSISYSFGKNHIETDEDDMQPKKE